MDIIRAASKNDLAGVQRELSWGSDPNSMNEYGMFPLKLATQNGNFKMVRALVERGARVDMRGREGATALMSAAWIGRTDIARYLIDSGASIYMRDAQGRTPYDRAVMGGHCNDYLLIKALEIRWSRSDIRSRGSAHLIIVGR